MTARFTHIRALDGLRGVAVVAVVLYHFAPDVAPGGFLGVDLFFVLSGFLITSLLISEWDATAKISLPSFWARRARRLLPALFLVFLAVGVYALLLSDRVDAQHISLDGVWAFGYVANWHFIASGQTYIQQFLAQTPSPLRHTWSLAIEEQFYLVWPILVLLVGMVVGRGHRRDARRRRDFRRTLLLLCIALGAASYIRMITLYEPGGDPNRVYYGTDTRAFIILIGAALAVITATVPQLGRTARSVLVTLGTCGAMALVVAMASITTSSSWLYEGGYGALALVMAIVLAAASQTGTNPLAILLRCRPLVGLGLISYGVYLWHWPVGLWVRHGNTGLDGIPLFLLRSAITLGAALLSYRFVEQPIRRGWLPKLGRVKPVVVIAAVAASVAAVLVVPAIAFPSVRSIPAPVAPAREAVGVTAGYAGAPRCDGGPKPAPIDPGHRLRVQLEGNSLAGEIRICLGSILRARGATLEGVNPPGFLICHEIPAIRDQVRKRATHPDAAILFLFIAYDARCGQPWHGPVDQLVSIWKAAGTHIYLVPSVPFILGTPQQRDLGPGPLLEAEYYRSLAEQDPEHITLLDAGTFIRGPDGQYLWGMPCLPGGEPGCDKNGNVGVRYIDGLHFCTDPEFAAHGCSGRIHQAGERRAAAAVAAGLLPSLQAVRTARSTAPK